MDTRAAEEVLKEMVRRTPGVSGVLLITDDGFPIVSTLQADDTEMKSTAVGAILCDSGQRGIQELGLGTMDAVVTIGSDGFFVVSRVGAGILLMAVASQDVLLGLVLLRFRKAMPLLVEAIAREPGEPAGS